MLLQYISGAMQKAHYEILSDDQSYYGEIQGFDGVWANADTLEACRQELQEVLEEWILMHVARHVVLPVVDGVTLSVEPAA